MVSKKEVVYELPKFPGPKFFGPVEAMYNDRTILYFRDESEGGYAYSVVLGYKLSDFYEVKGKSLVHIELIDVGDEETLRQAFRSKFLGQVNFYR